MSEFTTSDPDLTSFFFIFGTDFQISIKKLRDYAQYNDHYQTKITPDKRSPDKIHEKLFHELREGLQLHLKKTYDVLTRSRKKVLES